MKTPEHWRPSHIVPSLSVFLPKDVKWCHDVTLWRHSMKWSSTGKPIWKSHFSTQRPWPLTYDLDLQAYRRYCQGQPHNILGLYVMYMWFIRESANRHTYTPDRFSPQELIPCGSSQFLKSCVWNPLKPIDLFLSTGCVCLELDQVQDNKIT